MITITKIDPKWDLAEAKRIVMSMLKNYPTTIYLFGSRATGNATTHSDIDIAILPENKLPLGVLSEIRDALENSNVIYNVDIVDLSEVTESFKNRVMEEGQLWSA